MISFLSLFIIHNVVVRPANNNPKYMKKEVYVRNTHITYNSFFINDTCYAWAKNSKNQRLLHVLLYNFVNTPSSDFYKMAY